MSNLQIGQSMAKQAPIALLINVLIFAALFTTEVAPITTVVTALVFGVLTSLLLLGYWHGKGGSFFIIALLMPLVLVVVSELTSFLALAWLINGFFSGAALLLLVYGLILKRRN